MPKRYRKLQVKNLSKVLTWLEQDSNPRPSGQKASTLPMRHHTPLASLFCFLASGGASPLLKAGHRQVISRTSKGSQNIFIYNFTITTFDFQGHSQCRGMSWCGSATVPRQSVCKR